MTAPCRPRSKTHPVFLPAVFLATQMTAGHVVAQQLLTIPSEPSCPTCAIRLEHVTTIGLDAAGDYVYRSSSVARTKAGFVFARGVAGTEVIEVREDGSLLNIIGRAGQGPGEYQVIRALVSDAFDSVYVFDGLNLRMTVLTPAREVARTLRLPSFSYKQRPVMLNGGDWIVNTPYHTPDLVGYPLHRMGSDGRILRSFGATADETRQDRVVGHGQIRHVVRVAADSLWAAHLLDYRLDHYDAAGELVGTLVGVPPWDVLNRQQQLGGYPLGAVLDIGVLPSGCLLLVSRVADPRWQEEVIRTGVSYTIRDYNHYYDSVIDVVDPYEGTLVVRQLLDAFVVAVIDGQTVAAIGYSPTGGELIDIYRLIVNGSGL